jgi:hypothetical protein
MSLIKTSGLSIIIVSYVILNGAQRSEESPGQLPRLFPPAPSRHRNGIGICPTRDRPSVRQTKRKSHSFQWGTGLALSDKCSIQT